MNNVVACVAPKSKTMVHSMSLNNRISYMVGISIFGFKAYWKWVFNLMEIKTTPAFKILLQDETLDIEKKRTYFQQYNVKILRSFHKQAMIKKITRTYLQGEVRCNIVQGCSFKQVSSTCMNQIHSPWTINQYIQRTSKMVPVWLLIALTYQLKGFPYRDFLPKRKKWPWGWVFLKKRRRRKQNMH